MIGSGLQDRGTKHHLRVGVVGCGFWARYQINGWRELSGVEIAGIYNRTRSKAESLAFELGIKHVYGTAEELIPGQFASPARSCQKHAPQHHRCVLLAHEKPHDSPTRQCTRDSSPCG